MSDTLVNQKKDLWFKVYFNEADFLVHNGPALQVFIYLKKRVQMGEAGDVVFHVNNSVHIPVHLEVGEAIFTRSHTAKATGLSEQSVRTALKFLEKVKILTIKPTKMYTIVSFNKSDVYKDKKLSSNQHLNQGLTNIKPTSNQDLTSNLEPIEPIDTKESSVADAPSLPAAPEKPKKSTRFVPPSVEEVEEYCRERGNSVNAQCFVDFYSSKGWKVGNQSMKDWQACVRTWERRDGFKYNPKQAEEKTHQLSLFDSLNHADDDIIYEANYAQ